MGSDGAFPAFSFLGEGNSYINFASSVGATVAGWFTVAFASWFIEDALGWVRFGAAVAATCGTTLESSVA
jgi:hypothetical protein